MTFNGITHKANKCLIDGMTQGLIHTRNRKPIWCWNESEQITFLISNRKMDLPFSCMGGYTNRTDIKGSVHKDKILKNSFEESRWI